MDKNTIIGFVLIAALLIGFSWYTQPSEEDIAKQRMQDSITALAKKKAEESRSYATSMRLVSFSAFAVRGSVM